MIQRQVPFRIRAGTFLPYLLGDSTGPKRSAAARRVRRPGGELPSVEPTASHWCAAGRPLGPPRCRNGLRKFPLSRPRPVPSMAEVPYPE